MKSNRSLIFDNLFSGLYDRDIYAEQKETPPQCYCIVGSSTPGIGPGFCP